MTDAYLSTGILELDRILAGGLLVRDGRFPSVVIAGEPGCGKTTVALTLASETVARGASAIIVNLEERPIDSHYLASQYGLFNSVHNTLFDEDPADWPTDWAAIVKDVPIACYSFFPDLPKKALSHFGKAVSEDADVNSLISYIKDRLDNLKRLCDDYGIPPIRMIVVDSLPYLPDGVLQYALQRALFKALCDLSTKHQSVIVIVSERSASLDWREFVADIVLEITWKQDAVAGEVRSLKALKTRYQASWEGGHILRMDRNTGLSLFPQASAVVRHARQVRPAGPSYRMVRFTVDSNFDRLLALDQSFPGEAKRDLGVGAGATHSTIERDVAGRVQSGSMALLYGEDETRKNVVAVRFLQAAFGEVPNGRAIFVSCGAGEETARDIVQRYWLRAEGLESDFNRVEVVAGPGAFEAVDEFFGRLLKAIHSSREPVTRVLVDDEAALLRNDYYAVPTVELLRELGITSLFVRTVNSGHDDNSREQFDHVLRSRHLILPTGESRIGYRVLKFRGAAVSSSRSFEMRLSDPNGLIEIVDTFKFYREGADARLSSIPWHLRLYFPSDDQSDFWGREIRGLFGTVYAGKDAPRVQQFGRLDTDAVFQAVNDIPQDYPLMGTEVINFDDYWGSALAERKRLVPLTELFSSEEVSQFKRGFYGSVWRDAPRCAGTGEILGVPHHVDFGIFTVRTDVLVACGINLSEFLDQNGRPATACWDGYVRLAGEVGKRIKEITNAQYRELCGSRSSGESSGGPPTIRMFDASSNHIDESFLCFILEVVWPFVENPTMVPGLPVFDSDGVREALIALFYRLGELGSIPIPESTMQGDSGRDSGRAAETLTLFQRQWFVSRWAESRRRGFTNKHCAIIEPPRLRVGEVSRQATALRGSWYLGVVRGSPDLLRAASAIRTLTSEVACRNLQRAEMGLPPLASLLSGEHLVDLPTERFDELYGRTKSRSEIPFYNQIRTLLTIQFRDIFSHTPKEISDLTLRGRVGRATALIDAFIRERCWASE
ncbi:MAG: ATPase domain-containing protein [Planctomycetales bacterium]